MIALVAATAIAALTSPSPVVSPTTTVLLNYSTPPRGYRSQVDLTAVGAHFTITALTDPFGNRDVDATISANGKTTRQEYLFMSGLAYVKTGDTWSLATNLPPAFMRVMFLAGVYPVAAGMAGRIIHPNGTAACGASTCSLYVSSQATKVQEKPAVTVSHYSVDKATNTLVALDATTFDTSGQAISQIHASFDQFGGQKLPVPAIAVTTQPTCYASNTSAGALSLCLFRGSYSLDVYTLTVNGQLALRANETVLASNPVSSPVVDGLTLGCSVKKQTNVVNPNLVATLKQTGMTDEQIAEQLGQKAVSSDCTVSSGGAPVMTQHFDF
jgi:hypothetical protein